MNRNAVFLQEIGIGVQWRLRTAPAGEAEQDLPEVEADLSAAAVADVPVHVEAQPQPQATVTVRLPEPTPSPLPQPVAVAVAPPVSVTAADPDNAWFDNTPLPATPPPTVTKSPAKPVQPAPSRPVANADDAESTAWFDDVPVPDAGMAPAYAGREAGQPGSVSGQFSSQDIANMDWPALQAAVNVCTRCDLCQSRKVAVAGRGDPHAQWLVLGTAPLAADEEEGRAIAGEAGQLLDNMLKAIALTPDEDAYVTTLVKCRPPAGEDGNDRLPSGDELAACRPYLERQLELAGSRMILTLGHTTGKGLLGAAARGKVLRFDGIPTIATYHPADLLRKPADKAKAWADLCLAKAAHAGRA